MRAHHFSCACISKCHFAREFSPSSLEVSCSCSFLISTSEKSFVKDIAKHFQSLGVYTGCGLFSAGSLLADRLVWKII